MASAVLFERNSCSTSGSTLKAACRTEGDKAFHTEELPAKWVNIVLPKWESYQLVKGSLQINYEVNYGNWLSNHLNPLLVRLPNISNA